MKRAFDKFAHSLFLSLAKSDELPKKVLGQERPVLLLPLQQDPPVQVKMSLQPHSTPSTEALDTTSTTQTPSPAEPQGPRSPVVSLPDPAVESERPNSRMKPCRTPPSPPTAKKPTAEVRLERGEDEEEVLSAQQTEEEAKPETQPGSQEMEIKPFDWPPPYEPSASDVLSLQPEEVIMDLPDLPPPPFFYSDPNDQSALDPDSPCRATVAEANRSSSTHIPSPPPLQNKPSPQPSPRPPTSLNFPQKHPSPSKRSPPCAFATHSSCSPRPPPHKPTKFPVSLYVPGATGDRRPSNTSQYDNLSEADEDDRCLERTLVPTPEETPSAHGEARHTVGRAYDPVLYPIPPPPVFIPPSHSPIPPSVGGVPSLPQEPEYEGDDSWVRNTIIPPPPPTFADRLSPYQCKAGSCSDTHRASSPGYSKPFSRGPRDHSAFPAPLLYTGSPPGLSRPSGQSPGGVPLVRSSPDFCRVAQGGQLPKSVTF